MLELLLKIKKGLKISYTNIIKVFKIGSIFLSLSLILMIFFISTKNDFEKIDTKIVYATIIELLKKNIEKNDLEKIVLIDVPSEIYQELRKIFVSLFESSGFKDIQINQHVDFEKLYSMKKVQ